MFCRYIVQLGVFLAVYRGTNEICLTNLFPTRLALLAGVYVVSIMHVFFLWLNKIGSLVFLLFVLKCLLKRPTGSSIEKCCANTPSGMSEK